MTSQHDPDDIHVLVEKCTTAFDNLLRQIPQSGSIDGFPSEPQIRLKRQQFCKWAEDFGANIACSSRLSLDYKFRAHDLARDVTRLELQNLNQDLDALAKLYGGSSRDEDARIEAKVCVNRIGGILDGTFEKSRFLKHLPKESWVGLEEPSAGGRSSNDTGQAR
ncbi:hypothetical protein ACJ41O_000631 [Fusarium nematophilum]